MNVKKTAYRLIASFLIIALILNNVPIPLINNIQKAHADQVDAFGLPLVAGTNYLGETKGAFAVSEKGSATYHVELKTPPGTNGMQPNLALDYDSQGQNSYLGVGWNLSGLSLISRCPTTLAQDGVIHSIGFDSQDKLCLDGQRLVAVSGSYFGALTEYRTENEIFARISVGASTSAGPTYLTARMKNGLIYTYGNTPDSKIQNSNGSTLIWKLNKIADQFGNYLTIEYTNNSATGENYPINIYYSGNSTANVSPYNRVTFQYESRPDAKVSYLSGVKLSVTQRLKRVLMYSNNQLAWDYELTYDQAPSTNRSRVISLKQCDANNNCLAPVQFTWQNGTTTAVAADQQWATRLSWSEISPSNSQERLEWVQDMDGDGLPDFIFQMGGTDSYYVRHNTGTGFGPEILWGTRQFPIADNGKAFWFQDMNGDGKLDLVYNSTPEYNNQPLRIYVKLANANSLGWGPDVLWGQLSFALPHLLGNNASQIRQWLLDYNGDSLPDYICDLTSGGSGGNFYHQFYVMLNTGQNLAVENLWGTFLGSFSPKEVIDVNNDGLTDLIFDQTAETMFANPQGLLGTNSFVSWWGWGNGGDVIPEPFADFNGDQLPEYTYQWVLNGPSQIFADINTGAPSNAQAIVWGVRPYESTDSLYRDMNGDGLSDVVYTRYGTQQIHVMLTQPSGLAGPDQIWGTRSTGIHRGWFIDMNGDGLTDELYLTPADNVFRVFLNSSPVPDLMTQIQTGQGETTTVNYVSLTNSTYYQKDSGNIFPALNLIGPMQVVGSFQTSDGVGGTATTTYKYYGLKTTTNGRGMCGFRQIDTTDQNTGIKTTATYRQDFPYKTLPLRKEVHLSNGTLISVDQNTWNQIVFPAGNYFVYQDLNTEEKYDLQGNLMFTVTTDKDYDNFGNVTTMNITRSDGWNETTTNTYSNDTLFWHIGRLTNSSVVKSSAYAPSQTRQSSFSYSFTTGALTTENIEPNNSLLRLTKTFTYDVYGNTLQKIISGPNISNRVESTTYDSRGQFPVSTTNPLNQTGTTIILRCSDHFYHKQIRMV